MPSESCLETIRQFELTFAQLHGSDNLCREKDIITKLCTTLGERLPKVCKEIIRMYARTRTVIGSHWLSSKDKSTSKKGQKMAYVITIIISSARSCFINF